LDIPAQARESEIQEGGAICDRRTDQSGGFSGVARWSHFEAAWPLISSVQGWLAQEEAAALHAAAGRVPVGQWIVEIGASRGRSTSAMATGKQPGVPVLTIDPYEGPRAATAPDAMRAFCEYMDRVGADHEVQLFWGTSEEAARSLSLVFRTAAARTRALDDAATTSELTLVADAQEGPAPCGQRVFRLEKSPRTSTSTEDAQLNVREPEIGLLFIDGLHDEA
jgi:hypothetical protein